MVAFSAGDSGSPPHVAGNSGKSGGLVLKVDHQPNAGWQAVGATENGDILSASGAPVVLNEEVHLAAVWDAPELRLFVNGSLAGEESFEERPGPSSRVFRIGTNVFNGENWVGAFNGRIDEVRVSNVVRYAEDFTPEERFEPDEHTLALYHFDEGEGNALIDSSGNGHHGQIHGASWVCVDGESRQ